MTDNLDLLNAGVSRHPRSLVNNTDVVREQNRRGVESRRLFCHAPSPWDGSLVGPGSCCRRKPSPQTPVRSTSDLLERSTA